MQKCKKCKTTFSWYKLFKSFTWTYKTIECTSCKTKHAITLFGKCTVAFLIILPMWVFYTFSPFSNSLLTIGGGFLLAIIGFMLSPFVAHYKVELSEIHDN